MKAQTHSSVQGTVTVSLGRRPLAPSCSLLGGLRPDAPAFSGPLSVLCPRLQILDGDTTDVPQKCAEVKYVFGPGHNRLRSVTKHTPMVRCGERLGERGRRSHRPGLCRRVA